VVAVAAAPRRRAAPPAAPVMYRDVVYAYRRPTDQTWQMLDPVTGGYRGVDVGAVTMPTADLRYAAVTPRIQPTAAGYRVGRYESATGYIRWYPVPVPIDGVAQLSPDGRYVLLSVRDSPAVAIMDLDTGGVAQFDTAGAGVDRGPNPLRQWQSDGRHVLTANFILDVTGRLTGYLDVPSGDDLVTVRPDAAALLLRRPAGGGRTTLILTDPHGAALGQVTVDTATFVAWRGPDRVLVSGGPGDPMRELDLRTGRVSPVHLPIPDGSADRLVVAPVVRLSDAALATTF
jgi:hypothetical protein